MPDTKGKVIRTHIKYIIGQRGALDGVEWLYYALEGDRLGAALVAAERLIHHAVQLSCERYTGYINYRCLQNRLGSRARLWRPSVHFYGFFWTEDVLTSSNQRETTAVLRALLHFHPMIRASNIRAIAMQMDNVVIVYNLRRQGASGGKLLQATRAIFLVLTKLDIRILMSHVPGADNVLTDTLSRMDTAGDYELLPGVFRDEARALGSNPMIDLFASRYNHKLVRFAALPGKSAGRAVVEDALMFSWMGEIPYAFPPVQMVARVLQKLGRDEVASALVVVLAWPSQPWWNLLQSHAVVQRDLGDSNEILRRSPSLTAEH
jgi:hypothetical protein